MDTKALRQKILDLAIRGKLVPQDPNDEPAEVLLERIREQKQQMLKEGKLKKKDIKNDTIIFKGEDNLHYEKFQDGIVKCIEDEIPFGVPEGWCWSRLQSITSILTDGTHNTPQYSDDGYIFLSSKNVTSGKIDWDNIMYIPETLHHELYTRLAPKAGDILLAKNGTTGVAAIVDREEVFDIYVSLALIRIVDNIVNPLYVLRAIESSFIQDYFNNSLKGIGVPNLHLEHIRKTLIPIPPCAEQDRIILRADTFLLLVEQIATDETELQHLISQAKAKILDLAIRGKLVPQNPDDEPASVLLERIHVKKEELIKQGKIKRDKKEAVIFKGDDNSYYEKVGEKIKNIDDEIPFSLPEGWKWVYLSNIASVLNGDRGQNYPAKSRLLKDGIPFVSASNIKDGIVVSDGLLCLSESQYNTLGAGKLISGDIVYCIRGSLGKCGIFTMEKGAIASSLVIVRSIVDERCASDYIFAYLNSSLASEEIKKYDNGSAQPNLAAKDFMHFLVPLPPLKEQNSICNKMKTMFTLIEDMEKSLS